MKPDASMALPLVQSLNNCSPSNTLTPTTLKRLTDILESEECLENIQKLQVDQHEELATNLTTSSVTKHFSNKTFVAHINGWQGGTTTVVSPDKNIPLLDVFMNQKIVVPEEDVDQASVDDGKKDIFVQRQEMLAGKMNENNSDNSNSVVHTRRSSRLARNGTASNFASIVKRCSSSSPPPAPRAAKSRKTGGRKPSTNNDLKGLSPEEEERIRMRRQRNKEAAARCRKRRVDLTNSLMKEVEEHEAQKAALEEEIRMLKGQKEDLEFILQAHSQHCQLTLPKMSTSASRKGMYLAVKSEPVVVEDAFTTPDIIKTFSGVDIESCSSAKENMDHFDEVKSKPQRPMSLSLGSTDKEMVAGGVAIETPTSVIPFLSYENVSTGLTPSAPSANFVTSLATPTLNTPTVTRNCGSQHQKSLETPTSSSYLAL